MKSKNEYRKFDLEERLIRFAVNIIMLTNDFPKTRAGNHLGRQLIRSGTSPAFNYGESMSAESLNDFIHKMKVALKELRETHIGLKIIDRISLIKQKEKIVELLSECNELISIFVKSIKTATTNKK